MVDIDDKKGSTITKPPTPTLHSLDDLQIHLSPDIRQHLADQYKDDHHYMERLLNAMKRPTATTICRVNLIQATRAQVVQELKRILSSHHHHVVQESPIFSDVVTIVTQDTASSSSLSSHAIPQTSPNTPSLFPNWPKRKDKGWPMTHKVILVDRFCGEAVLRGSDIFVKGVMAADYGIKPGEIVAVYADIPTTKTKTDLNGKARTVPHKVARGLLLEHYSGTCVFLGLGTTACARGEMFNQDRGVAVTMSMEPHERVGPLLPPLYGVLDDKMMLQNLPSILVAHALNPQPHDTVLDMCMAPGGKTAHLASLVNNQAVIVACDKSRKKVVSAKSLFARLGASCVTPLALDATKCVSDDSQEPTSIRKVRAFVNEKCIVPFRTRC
jgi:predicted ribosome-associated RNA-binding protein Tma20